MSSSIRLNQILLVVVFYSTFQVVDNKIRHRRQYFQSNRLQQILMSNQQSYQYPTPVNVISGGSYNPGQYDTYPDHSSDYYPNLNDMRLPSSNLQNGNSYPSNPRGFSNRFIMNTAQILSNSSLFIKVLLGFFIHILALQLF
ncbi:unnamed protein product [Adineta ricciae]|uniref:Uncharacterized protein n=1 Tax=Adineta ricciae TaxID=249248 RepID=A0A813SHH2_ADIRI|nr:unnamed protein product [Adineta ricciae]CAF0958255.1 unnamed protein product [Adineta ricciae]